MKGYRNKIRDFLEVVEWCNPRNIAFLIHGNTERLQWADCELHEMTKAKGDPIKRLPNEYQTIYAKPTSPKKDKGSTNLLHDLNLRDVLARYLFDRNYEGIDKVSVKRIGGMNPDAHIGNIYFEMDNGREEPNFLAKKLLRYSGRGNFQVIFIMGHRQGRTDLEHKRLAMIQELGNKILVGKPNRILSATYHGFLDNGHLVNLRGEERCV